jgi:hypothetical protein
MTIQRGGVVMHKYGLIGLLLVNASVYGAQECSEIEEREARLVCFDKLYPGDDVIIKEVPVESKSESPPVVVVPIADANETATSSEQAVASEPTVAPTPSVDAEQPKAEGWSLFGKREEVIITATITNVLEGETQKMVFQLDNGQVWLQTSPRNLPIGIGDEVTIKSGMIGGYIMRSSSGTSTRVQLID